MRLDNWDDEDITSDLILRLQDGPLPDGAIEMGEVISSILDEEEGWLFARAGDYLIVMSVHDLRVLQLPVIA